MKYYLLSFKCTHSRDLLFTLWKSNAIGYTFFKGDAGIYGEREANVLCSSGKAGGDVTVFKVEKKLADGFFVPVMYEGKVRQGLPINEFTLQELGVKLEDLKKERPSDTAGIEFVLDTEPNFRNEIKTKHDLDFLVAPDPYKLAPDCIFELFKVGTCEGQFRTTPDAIEILSIFNSEPGNGHLDDVFQWFEHSAKEHKLKLRILELWNEKFEQHLIGKRGFVPVDHEGVLALEKTFGTVFTLQPANVHYAPKNQRGA